jgi:predicted regulator of Ras-like GTPase activity (Roadblock/LC7/MglB family)
MMQQPMSEQARMLFATAIGEAEQTALLLDSGGATLAGSYIDQSGRDISGEIGAALSGVGREVSRSMRMLSIGNWTAVVVETDAATIALAPATDDAVVLLASSSTVPLGLVRRVLTRSVALAINWMRDRIAR